MTRRKPVTEEPAAEEMVTIETAPEPETVIEEPAVIKPAPKPAHVSKPTPAPKAAKPAPRQPGTEYLVADPDVASLSFHGETYPVIDGKVFIPKGETWHLDLVGSFLKEEE